MADIKRLLMHEQDKVKQMAKDIFDELDCDGSGFIDEQEMGQLLTEMAIQLDKPPPTPQQIKEEILRIDKNSDGKIDPDEFTEVIVQILKDMAGI